MVQKINKNICKLLTILGFGIAASSCDKSDSCESANINYKIGNEYRNWFETETTSNFQVNKTNSSLGVTETMSVSKRSEISSENIGSQNCTMIHGEKLSINYQTSLYSYFINFELIQKSKNGAPWLTINNKTPERHTEIPFQLTTKEAGFITLTDYEQKIYFNKTVYKPEVNYFDSLEIGGIQHYEVYQVTDTYLKANGKDYELTDYYLNKNGLIRYDQKDGVSWVIEPQ